jgi:hypothetical protein
LPQALNKHVIAPATFTVHALADAFVLEQFDERPADELTALVGVEDFRRALDFGSGPFGAWDLLDKLGDEFDRLGAFKPNSPLYDDAVRFLSHGGEVLRPILTSMNQFKERFQVPDNVDMEGGNGEFASRVSTPPPGAAGFRDAEGIPAEKPATNPQEVSKTTGTVIDREASATAGAPPSATSAKGAGYNASQAAGDRAGIGEENPGGRGVAAESGQPTGTTFKGTIYRAVANDHDPLIIHPGNVQASHRYTAPGQGALYFATGKHVVEAGFVGNCSTLAGTQMHAFQNQAVTNLLDLSNPAVRNSIGVKLDDLTRIGGTKAWRYEVTQHLRQWVQKNDYDEIIASSTQADGRVNIILFNAKRVRN